MKAAQSVIFAASMMLGIGSASADVIYSSLPTYAPGTNVISQGYSCCQVSELGDYIGFSGTARSLTTVTLTLSNWNDAGFTHPLTLNLYDVAGGPTAGNLLASRTQSIVAPAHTPNGFGGLAFNVSFDFTGVIVPNQIMYGLTFTTQLSNPSDPGPWDSLNFGLWNYNTGGDGFTIPVGTDFDTTANAGGASTIVYGRSSNSPAWTANPSNALTGLDAGYTPAIEFDAVAVAVPEPTTLALFGAGLAGLGAMRRRRKSRSA
jgi:hypothetical protein